MIEKSGDLISSTLNGLGFNILRYPDNGMDEITEPGFYYNSQAAQIEHWSEPCEYNNPMRSNFSNRNGIIQDGFQSVLAFEDINGLSAAIDNWNKHLIRYGVV